MTGRPCFVLCGKREKNFVWARWALWPEVPPVPGIESCLPARRTLEMQGQFRSMQWEDKGLNYGETALSVCFLFLHRVLGCRTYRGAAGRPEQHGLSRRCQYGAIGSGRNGQQGKLRNRPSSFGLRNFRRRDYRENCHFRRREGSSASRDRPCGGKKHAEGRGFLRTSRSPGAQ